ncbi:PTS sugar transporter subunit IIA [Myxococcus llanfairpwllgwyngyllgogerychwyrndrobwllllantysiliogogogochensis]|uniref:PTS sugar transporter subunit IIA n=1 Tax=Myxococcus llanfairpwllgwyngyllgogerychwyrndrobwllllantysiliogogogochensis TaxID=2590453 RepID=A0A540X5V7_9BACT|nr:MULTISPECIES: PTS sugar transporter subunit IIA [Myxococcus]NTX10334.1 PTS sugar transporter subunit IIA [Myxococcus sp. CA056]TQF16637.1 PTS sugar transporter subunit IIA [Myxococcus llanfairpwllgwyngyllgogerychwyrndrobwllllantysiliogogogochensis]
MLRWTDFLDVEAVRLSLEARERVGVVHELAGLMSARARVSPKELAAHLLAREQLGSTAMVGGVAVPHCRLAGVSRIVTCVGVHSQGVDFGEADGGRVHVFVGMVSPPDTAGLHLNVLARIGALLRNARLREALLTAPSPSALRALLVCVEDAHVNHRSEVALAR